MKTRRSDDRQSYVAARNFAEHIEKVAKLDSWKNIGEDLKKDMEGAKKVLFSQTKSYRGRYNELSYVVKDRNGQLLIEPIEKLGPERAVYCSLSHWIVTHDEARWRRFEGKTVTAPRCSYSESFGTAVKAIPLECS